LVQYPFTDLSGTKVRPAVAVHAPHPSPDLIIVPLTSQISSLFPGEFVLADWAAAGLHLPTAVKRGFYAIHPRLVIKRLNSLSPPDAKRVESSIRMWLGV
jgi:mRNA interferase MazF